MLNTTNQTNKVRTISELSFATCNTTSVDTEKQDLSGIECKVARQVVKRTCKTALRKLQAMDKQSLTLQIIARANVSEEEEMKAAETAKRDRRKTIGRRLRQPRGRR